MNMKNQKIGLFLLLAFFTGTFLLQRPSTCYSFEIQIEIAPATLNLQSEGAVVTVHTDIIYSAVDVSSIYLNGVFINSWKADNQGNFVAKFIMEDIKILPGLITGDYNLLKIVGLTKDKEAFWGEIEITVVDNVPRGGR